MNFTGKTTKRSLGEHAKSLRSNKPIKTECMPEGSNSFPNDSSKRGISIVSPTLTFRIEQNDDKPAYHYTRRGQLMLNGFSFVRSIVNGAQNTINWRCAEAKKYTCMARVKTIGKQISAISHTHNHQPKREKPYSAIVWKGDS